MSRRITISHPEAHEKLTARLFWKLASESGYLDSGNVREYADATARSLVTRARSASGARHVNAEQTDLNHEAFTFLLDERVPEQDKLIRLARNLDDQQQAAVEAASATIENATVGRWFDIGAWNVANVAVSGSMSGALDEGTDYELDVRNGRIKVLEDGAVANGEILYLTFDQPGMELELSVSQAAPLFYCDIILEEYNQHSKMWLRRLTFRGNLNVTEFPNQAGEFATYRVKATPGGPVAIQKRPEAATLPSVEATVEAAGGSSSSSSSSSTYSSSSSSSSALSYTSSLSQSSLDRTSGSSQTNSSSSTAANVSSSSSTFALNSSSSSSQSVIDEESYSSSSALSEGSL